MSRSVSVSSTLTSKTTIDLAIGLTFSFFGCGFGFGLAASVGADDSPKRSSSSSTTAFFGYSFLAAGFPDFSIHFFIKSFEKLLMKRYQKWVFGYFPTSGSSKITKRVTAKIEEDLSVISAWESSFRKVGVWGEVWFDLINVRSWESHQQIWDMIINVENLNSIYKLMSLENFFFIFIFIDLFYCKSFKIKYSFKQRLFIINKLLDKTFIWGDEFPLLVYHFKSLLVSQLVLFH